MSGNRRMLYLECASGISGDMTVAALLDLGADEAVLRAALESLDLDGFEVRVSRVKKSGLDACDFAVILDHAHENHDHDMEYLHGHSHHHHDAAGTHHHPAGDPHSHAHRGPAEIYDIIDRADLTERAREIAKRTFRILARAEAKAHGVPEEEVHFHEVGAVDSIVDIVAAAVCFDDLGADEVIVRELCEGQGTIRCQHGIIPVPVPAVLNIAGAERLTLRITDIQGELVTPTGAALAAAMRTTDKLPDSFVVERVGLGAGKRQYECPGVLRAMLLSTDAQESDRICKLETNIDDSTGEILGYTMERLFEAGARDVFYAPIYMKKNRPAYLLSVICREEDADAMEEIIFRETTTIGIRRQMMERSVLGRRILRVRTSLGEADVKICGSGERIYPEYESAAELARRHGISCREACETILREAELQIKESGEETL